MKRVSGAAPGATLPERIVEPLLVDEHAAAALVGISFWTLREYVQAGEIPTVDFPSPLNPRRKLRRKLIDRADLLKFIEKHKSGGGK